MIRSMLAASVVSAALATPAIAGPCYLSAEYTEARVARAALPSDAEMVAAGTPTLVVAAVHTLIAKIDLFLPTSTQSCRTAQPAHTAMDDASDDLAYQIGVGDPYDCEGLFCTCQGPETSDDCNLVVCADDFVCLGDKCTCVDGGTP
ncbi:MAG: hypothetical protein ABMB14_17785 [Myxococcota bacterium]